MTTATDKTPKPCLDIVDLIDCLAREFPCAAVSFRLTWDDSMKPAELIVEGEFHRQGQLLWLSKIINIDNLYRAKFPAVHVTESLREIDAELTPDQMRMQRQYRQRTQCNDNRD